ncbi:nuclear factor Y, subunit C9 [Trifolium repens]|nr:nuclear factor Y, subunit C9 [Trifolium repens]
MDFNNNSVPLDFPSTPHLNEAMQNKEEKKFQSFWEKQMITLELDKEFKSQLALTRIRKTMKDDADMVSAESQLLMAKACELLIQELTFRAWLNTEERNRITVKPIDVAKAIMETDPFDDFFMDVVSQYCASCVKVENVENLTVANQHENIVQPADIPKAIIENDQMEIDQEFVQPFMMQPPFMPSDQFSFNYYQPNVRGTLLVN